MPNSQNRFISVIIPTFNRCSALRWCLEHLEVQTSRDFDVIVVDDGSSDDTPEMVALYKERSALELLFVRQKNAGPAAARNTAIRLTHSPLCLFIGDDILCAPHFVERHIELHQEKPAIATCGLGLTRWDRERQKLTPYMRAFEQLQFAYAELTSGMAADWKYFYTSNLSVKTELVRRYPFNERFPKAAMEDIELGYRISQSEDLKIEFLPQALASHYHPTTLKQACRRNITVGWSMHLFEECWPKADIMPPPQSGWKKGLRQTVDWAPLRLILTTVFSWVERFYCNGRLTRELLDSYLRNGYRKREVEMRLSSGAPQILRAS